MGAGGSKQADIADPFPISPSQNVNLDKLSRAVARILSTPDIYDINNLTEPGECGKYVVFLKEELMKYLNPFVAYADLSDGRGTRPVEVLYQNPRVIIKDEKARKAICSQLSDTVLRVAFLVVACLASMQVNITSRQVAIGGIGAPPMQKGGGLSDVASWLRANGFTAIEPQLNVPVEIIKRATDGRQMILTINSVESTYVSGTITFRNPQNRNINPNDSLYIEFLDPLTISAQFETMRSVLPVRVIHKRRGAEPYPLFAGLIYNKSFKSFYSADPYDVIKLMEDCLRAVVGNTPYPLIEKRDHTLQAGVLFNRLKGSSNRLDDIQTFNPQLIGIISAALARPYAYPPVAAQYGYPPLGQPYGVPPVQQYPQQYGVQPYVQRPVGVAGGGGAPYPGISRLGQQPAAYQVPTPTIDSIKQIVNNYKQLSPTESNPAAVRAQTLRGQLNPMTRTLETGVCQDIYWTGAPYKIYPWATLQILSVKKWSDLSKITGGGSSGIEFEKEWTEFIAELSAVYSGGDVPKLETNASNTLAGFKFTNVSNIPICKSSSSRVGFKEVQDCLMRLQAIYAQHVTSMWNILNSLIMIIVDPVTKTDAVRLHDAVLKGLPGANDESATSVGYVNKKAEEARKLIKEFYIAVEKEYLNGIRSLHAQA